MKELSQFQRYHNRTVQKADHVRFCGISIHLCLHHVWTVDRKSQTAQMNSIIYL